MIDPTTERKWIYKKADNLKLEIIPPKKTNIKSLSCPKEFIADLQNSNSSEGWSKNLANLPNLTLDEIIADVERVNKTFITKLKKIEEHFQRGQQFLEENLVDLNYILSKQSRAICDFIPPPFFTVSATDLRERFLLSGIFYLTFLIPREAEDCPRGDNHSKHMPLPTYLV